MHQLTLDAIAFIRKTGPAEILLTFTGNLKWPEISSELFQNQNSNNRHDIIARVLNEKQ